MEDDWVLTEVWVLGSLLMWGPFVLWKLISEISFLAIYTAVKFCDLRLKVLNFLYKNHTMTDICALAYYLVNIRLDSLTILGFYADPRHITAHDWWCPALKVKIENYVYSACKVALFFYGRYVGELLWCSSPPPREQMRSPIHLSSQMEHEAYCADINQSLVI